MGEKSTKKRRAKVCLDCTGVSGAFFSRKSANHGLGVAKQGLGAAEHRTLKRKATKTLQKGMDGSVFGLHRRERTAFWRNSAKQGLGTEKQGSGAVRQSSFAKEYKNGRDECVFGPHRRERIAFLAFSCGIRQRTA